MSSTLAVTVVIILLTLAFDFINGFHDTATAVATSISTRALSPKAAIALCAVFNFVGAFLGTEVAKTVGDGIVDQNTSMGYCSSYIRSHYMESYYLVFWNSK